MSRVLTSILINSFRIKLFRFFFFYEFFIPNPNPLKCFHHQRSFKLRTNRKSYLLSPIVSMTSSYHRPSGVTCIVSGAWEFHGMCRKPDAPPTNASTYTRNARAIYSSSVREYKGLHPPFGQRYARFFRICSSTSPPLRPISFVVALIVCNRRFELGINKKYPEAILFCSLDI